MSPVYFRVRAAGAAAQLEIPLRVPKTPTRTPNTKSACPSRSSTLPARLVSSMRCDCAKECFADPTSKENLRTRNI
jgi:hypothetical protein